MRIENGRLENEDTRRIDGTLRPSHFLTSPLLTLLPALNFRCSSRNGLIDELVFGTRCLLQISQGTNPQHASGGFGSIHLLRDFRKGEFFKVS